MVDTSQPPRLATAHMSTSSLRDTSKESLPPLNSLSSHTSLNSLPDAGHCHRLSAPEVAALVMSRPTRASLSHQRSSASISHMATNSLQSPHAYHNDLSHQRDTGMRRRCLVSPLTKGLASAMTTQRVSDTDNKLKGVRLVRERPSGVKYVGPSPISVSQRYRNNEGESEDELSSTPPRLSPRDIASLVFNPNHRRTRPAQSKSLSTAESVTSHSCRVSEKTCVTDQMRGDTHHKYSPSSRNTLARSPHSSQTEILPDPLTARPPTQVDNLNLRTSLSLARGNRGSKDRTDRLASKEGKRGERGNRTERQEVRGDTQVHSFRQLHSSATLSTEPSFTPSQSSQFTPHSAPLSRSPKEAGSLTARRHISCPHPVDPKLTPSPYSRLNLTLRMSEVRNASALGDVASTSLESRYNSPRESSSGRHASLADACRKFNRRPFSRDSPRGVFVRHHFSQPPQSSSHSTNSVGTSKLSQSPRSLELSSTNPTPLGDRPAFTSRRRRTSAITEPSYYMFACSLGGGSVRRSTTVDSLTGVVSTFSGAMSGEALAYWEEWTLEARKHKRTTTTVASGVRCEGEGGKEVLRRSTAQIVSEVNEATLMDVHNHNYTTLDTPITPAHLKVTPTSPPSSTSLNLPLGKFNHHETCAGSRLTSLASRPSSQSSSLSRPSLSLVDVPASCLLKVFRCLEPHEVISKVDRLSRALQQHARRGDWCEELVLNERWRHPLRQHRSVKQQWFTRFCNLKVLRHPRLPKLSVELTQGEKAVLSVMATGGYGGRSGGETDKRGGSPSYEWGSSSLARQGIATVGLARRGNTALLSESLTSSGLAAGREGASEVNTLMNAGMAGGISCVRSNADSSRSNFMDHLSLDGIDFAPTDLGVLLSASAHSLEIVDLHLRGRPSGRRVHSLYRPIANVIEMKRCKVFRLSSAHSLLYAFQNLKLPECRVLDAQGLFRQGEHGTGPSDETQLGVVSKVITSAHSLIKLRVTELSPSTTCAVDFLRTIFRSSSPQLRSLTTFCRVEDVAMILQERKEGDHDGEGERRGERGEEGESRGERGEGGVRGEEGERGHGNGEREIGGESCVQREEEGASFDKVVSEEGAAVNEGEENGLRGATVKTEVIEAGDEGGAQKDSNNNEQQQRHSDLTQPEAVDHLTDSNSSALSFSPHECTIPPELSTWTLACRGLAARSHLSMDRLFAAVDGLNVKSPHLRLKVQGMTWGWPPPTAAECVTQIQRLRSCAVHCETSMVVHLNPTTEEVESISLGAAIGSVISFPYIDSLTLVFKSDTSLAFCEKTFSYFRFGAQPQTDAMRRIIDDEEVNTMRSDDEDSGTASDDSDAGDGDGEVVPSVWERAKMSEEEKGRLPIGGVGCGCDYDCSFNWDDVENYENGSVVICGLQHRVSLTSKDDRSHPLDANSSAMSPTKSSRKRVTRRETDGRSDAPSRDALRRAGDIDDSQEREIEEEEEETKKLDLKVWVPSSNLAEGSVPPRIYQAHAQAMATYYSKVHQLIQSHPDLRRADTRWLKS
eukprot:GHVN01034966.1.p1 GENE.GHVN01034966.1~~GHVN01034966.1.p1  ORF type:complete len:1521 (-),score=452.11 GHVN01034966.1:4882-9444(-)